MKYFVDLLNEPCLGCNGHTEVLTSGEYLVARAEQCMPGDMVRCTRCQCQGWVDCDADDIFVKWPKDLCAACHRAYERKFEALTHAIYQRLMEGVR